MTGGDIQKKSYKKCFFLSDVSEDVREWKSGMGELQSMDTDVQRQLAQALYAGSLVPILDKGADMPWC